MPSGLAALLDDVAAIAKLAAASVDDVSLAAGRAGAKAAGVVIDDAAVTPRYITGFTPDRELPIIWRIAKGSLKNKLLYILPVALLLSAFIPWAITPILMIGGAYLCFEGAEKVIEKLRDIAKSDEQELAEEVATLSAADHEEVMVAGAIRTDFILSAEIMAIALAELASGGALAGVGEGLPPVVSQALALGIVAIAITIGVYGVVGLIVKMDDIGLHMAKEGSAVRRATGRALVNAMPKLLAALALIGTAAMLWVGGQIIVHGLGLHPAEWVGVHGGLVEWLADAGISGAIGLVIGAVIVALHHAVHRLRHGPAEANDTP
jgi:predicted DNA repair protein MutK